MIICGNNRGQAVLEMSIFAVVLFMVLGGLISYIQQLNDQQYVQMETFRRALQTAGGSFPQSYLPEALGGGKGAGAAVNYVLVQHRRYTDFSDFFRKGQLVPVSGNASIYWAIPAIGVTKPQDRLIYRINDDEPLLPQIVNDVMGELKDSIPSIDIPILGESSITVGVADIKTDVSTDFKERDIKQESINSIITTKKSTLKDTIRTSFGYTVIPTGLASDLIGIDPAKFPQANHSITQRLYRDASGQYRYSRFVPEGTTVERGRTWETPIGK
ncbi:MAG: hypothetical protein PHO70_01100 [Candidatus Omnitrophica bacterium]|nr:hypothetical protein [Candidatus Omnitrophota bacterium]